MCINNLFSKGYRTFAYQSKAILMLILVTINITDYLERKLYYNDTFLCTFSIVIDKFHGVRNKRFTNLLHNPNSSYI